MSNQEIEIIREKARNEGFAQGRAEGAATVRGSCVAALREALAEGSLEQGVIELIDHLMSPIGDRVYGGTFSGVGAEANALRDKLLGRTAQAAGKPGETQAQAAERMLLENGIGTGKASASSPPDLGDQVVALLNAERGKL